MANISDSLEPQTRIAADFMERHKFEIRILSVIFAGLAIWFVLAMIASSIHPDSNSDNAGTALTYLGYAARNGGIFLAAAGIVGLFGIMRKTGDISLPAYIKSQMPSYIPSLKAAPVRIILGLASFALFIFSYSAIKTRIPEFAPYTWDTTFFEWDRALFFGHDPWAVFAWLYEIPMVIRIMDFVYDVWAAILVGTWALCFLKAKYSPSIRYRFPLALMITWFIGGNIAAIFLASAGPCYYGDVTGLADPYTAQMAKLAAIDAIEPLRAFQYQGILWQVYESPSVGLGGISAMPSMHCATSFLLVLFAWKRKVLRYAAIAFFLFILITSFMLAWHYMVDGLVAIPIALLGWWIAGKLTAKFQ